MIVQFYVDKGSDISALPTNYVVDSCGQYFEELVQLINSEYVRFLDIIYQELKAISTELTFVRLSDNFQIINSETNQAPSGSTGGRRIVGINVYNLMDTFPK